MKPCGHAGCGEVTLESERSATRESFTITARVRYCRSCEIELGKLTLVAFLRSFGLVVGRELADTRLDGAPLSGGS